MSRDATCVVQSLNWIRLTVPELYVFWGSDFIFLTRKRHFLGGLSKNATCGRGEEMKKRTETFMRQTGYLSTPPTST